MFSKNKNKNKNKDIKTQVPATKKTAPSIIGVDVVIKGNVSSQGLIQLDGKIEGNIQISSLTIGEQGWVDGSIEAQDVTIKGKVTGSIKAIKVTLERTAIVKGDIQHQTISIESGASIEASMVEITETKNVTKLENVKSDIKNNAKKIG